jgi:hypothetical protein
MATEKSMHTTPIRDDGIALDEPAAAVKAVVRPHIDEWDARQRVRTMSRELRRTTAAPSPVSTRIPRESRFDPPQDLFDQIEHATTPNISAATSEETTAGRLRTRSPEGGQIIAWLVVTAGTAALAAGIGLIAWSLGTEQMARWNLAMGLTLGGQGTLILGLVLVVSRLWRNSRYASVKLQEVHVRLARLQHTADALTAMRSGGAPAFYADLVRGASPQMLLTNLKGQLDQLATRLGSG